jgi:hypothetical protein
MLGGWGSREMTGSWVHTVGCDWITFPVACVAFQAKSLAGSALCDVRSFDTGLHSLVY